MPDTSNLVLILPLIVITFVLSYFGSTVGLMLGHFRLPILVYAMGSPLGAAGTNLGISMTGALAGALFHMREGRVNFRLLLTIGIPSMMGAIFSVLVVSQINHDWLKLLIGVMLIHSGFKMMRAKASNESRKERSLRQSLLIEGAVGAAIGALAGIVGLMLGSVRIPAMIRVLKIDPKEAVGTNMAIGFLTGLVGAITSVLVADANLWIIASVAPATLIGSYLGSRHVTKIDAQKLRQLLTWALFLTGGFMIAENFSKLN
ncbi:MAG: sulfite exporter TauE/SafE family protein [Cyanothece sp. SIO1E1]|nr:sulfite exporter TauE/SafE family protein [Cyanothece sp. SIO1E1]